jgi:hypothetical protein
VQRDQIPSRSGTGSTNEGAAVQAEGEEELAPLVKPSRKALGKRRAVADEGSECIADE